jgi:pyruvate dehydrogenase E1 component beta subunit
MRADDRVVFLGEDVGAAGGAFKTTVGLIEEFGPTRVWDTPISEQAIIGAAVGAALRGLRPIAEIMFADFMGTCWDGIANHAAKLRYMTNGQLDVPLVIRVHGGAGLGFGAQHSQLWDNLAMAIPGLKVVMPATPADVVGLMQSAVADPDPVLIIEHKGLFDVKGAVPDAPYSEPIGVARVMSPGRDVTIVTASAMVRLCEQAVAELAPIGISAELIDLRTLAPLDLPAVAASLERTGRLLLVEESGGACTWTAEVAARVAEQEFWSLDAPIRRVTGAATPIPFAGSLERAWLPDAARVVDAAKELVRG